MYTCVIAISEIIISDKYVNKNSKITAIVNEVTDKKLIIIKIEDYTCICL